MRPLRVFLAASAFLLCSSALFARAQPVPEQTTVDTEQAVDAAPPAYVAWVEGAVTVERDGQAQPATINMPFVPGDRLRTADGRAEILFPDGTALDVDESTALDAQDSVLFRLTSGRVILVVARSDDRANYEIDTPTAVVRTSAPGEYRIGVLADRPPVTELVVLRGEASIDTDRGGIALRAGERSVARLDEFPSLPDRVNLARLDAFDQWSAAHRDARVGTVSAQYLPPELQMYSGTFDQNGAWQYTSQYGYVWYPSATADWRPYYNGYWLPVRQYGWTWVGLDRWAWPTHHFGRWGFARGSWFWIPARAWSPAWVSWGAAPGYVSWCPLGFDNRAVFALSVGGASPWNGWVVVPRTSFGGYARPVSRHALRVDRLDDFGRRTPFIVSRNAPVPVPRRVAAGSSVTGNADARSAPPVAVGTAVPRGAPAPAGARQPSFGARQPWIGAPAASQSGTNRAPGSTTQPGAASVAPPFSPRQTPGSAPRAVERNGAGGPAAPRDSGPQPSVVVPGRPVRPPRAPEVARPRHLYVPPVSAPPPNPSPSAPQPNRQPQSPPAIVPTVPGLGAAVPRMGSAPSVAPRPAPAPVAAPRSAPVAPAPPAAPPPRSGAVGPGAQGAPSIPPAPPAASSRVPAPSGTPAPQTIAPASSGRAPASSGAHERGSGSGPQSGSGTGDGHGSGHAGGNDGGHGHSR